MEKKTSFNSTHVSLCLRTLHEGCRVLTNISDCTLSFCWGWNWYFSHLQPEDLIKALMELENSASQDAVVREKIANLPAEVQDVSLLEKIEGTRPMQLKLTSFYKLACTICIQLYQWVHVYTRVAPHLLAQKRYLYTSQKSGLGNFCPKSLPLGWGLTSPSYAWCIKKNLLLTIKTTIKKQHISEEFLEMILEYSFTYFVLYNIVAQYY